MNIYFIPRLGKQELSFSRLTHPAHSLIIILAMRHGGALVRQPNRSSNLQLRGPFLSGRALETSTSLKWQRSPPVDKY